MRPGTHARSDVAVIGVGLIGAAALRHLTTAGARCIGIGPAEPPDRSTHVGRFASHYDSGRVTRIIDHRLERAVLSQRAIAAYAPLSTRTGIEFHHPAGALHLAQDPRRLDELVRIASWLKVDHRLVSDVTAPVDPRLHLPQAAGVVVEAAPAGFIDPRRMLRAQIAAAQAGGAVVHRDEVLQVRRERGGWSLHCTSGRTHRAERLVVAAGAHLDEIAGISTGVSFDVYGETVVMAHLDDVEHRRLATLPSLVAQVDDGIVDDIYLVPPTTYPDGSTRLKLGASRQRPVRLGDHSSRCSWMRAPVADAELERLRAVATATVPGLRATGWSAAPCLIADTPSGLPVIDTIDDGVVIAAGCNGSAAKCADAIGQLAAALVTDGRWTDGELEASAFSVSAPGACLAGADDR
jgi:sarcosine oxidase